MMSPNESNEQDIIFKTGVSISERVPWYKSIFVQMRQRAEQRSAPHAEITAQPDPSALDKFVKSKSPFASLIATIRDIFAYRHHRIETTAAPIEVEELWSKDNSGYSGLVSVGLHLLLITAVVLPSFFVLQTPALTTTS